LLVALRRETEVAYPIGRRLVVLGLRLHGAAQHQSARREKERALHDLLHVLRRRVFPRIEGFFPGLPDHDRSPYLLSEAEPSQLGGNREIFVGLSGLARRACDFADALEEKARLTRDG